MTQALNQPGVLDNCNLINIQPVFDYFACASCVDSPIYNNVSYGCIELPSPLCTLRYSTLNAQLSDLNDIVVWYEDLVLVSKEQTQQPRADLQNVRPSNRVPTGLTGLLFRNLLDVPGSEFVLLIGGKLRLT